MLCNACRRRCVERSMISGRQYWACEIHGAVDWLPHEGKTNKGGRRSVWWWLWYFVRSDGFDGKGGR